MKRLFRCTGTTALLAVLLLGFFSGMAWATYEVTNVTTSASTGLTPQTGPAEDLEVEWTKPTMGGTDSLIEYVYIWNNSATLLDDTELNQSTNEGSVAGTLDPPFLTKDNQDFASDDYDDIWYLHIKTSYLSLTEGPKLSTDVVVGPFNFDNVAPTGTIGLDTSVAGQTATTSSVNPVTLSLTSAADTDTVYLGNSSTLALATESAFANSLSFEVTEGSGSKTIYAWFEDQAGNVSSAPVTLSFTLFEGKTMSPSGAVTIDLGAIQTFTILGAQGGETFDWAIIEASPADVASPLTAADVASVDITGDNEGTFKLQATSNTDAAVYTSGTITVQQSGYTITHSYRTGLNLVPFTLTGTGITKASELDAAIVAANAGVSVSQIFGWDGQNQRFSIPYANLGGGFTTGDFDLVSGASYFVQVSGTAALALTGSDYTTYACYAGLNLMAVPAALSGTVTSASSFDANIVSETGLTVSQIFGWDSANQRFSIPYANLGGGFTTGDFTLSIEEEGYFVQVSGNGTYQP